MSVGRLLFTLFVASGISLLTLGGCSQESASEPHGPMHVSHVDASKISPPTTTPVVLATGDQIELKFFYDNELNVTQTIRPDGKITLELVGEVQAAGLTPAALGADLKQRYTEYLKHPDIAVFVRQSYQRRVYVTGAVTKPTILDLPDNMSAFEAIMAAGGFNLVTANTTQVLVMRDDGHNGRIAYEMDMSGALHGHPTQSFELQPRDIVYVPRAPIVDVNQFVAQYIGGLIPDGLLYTKSFSNGATVGIQTTYNTLIGQ
jgi:protein involved in polysaccharide export with SLBB domain